MLSVRLPQTAQCLAWLFVSSIVCYWFWDNIHSETTMQQDMSQLTHPRFRRSRHVAHFVRV